MGAWDNLSIREKADIMKAAIRNGITTLPEIKQAYNEFAKGGNIYDGTKPHSSQMQKKYIYDILPELFAQDGVKISVTSGFRPGAVVRGTNKPSRHGLKQAADIVGDFGAIRKVLDDPNSNTSKWLLANGYGYLDETSKTGTTKFWHDKKRDHSHYHIGTDSGIVSSYAKKMQKLLSELPQQQETVSMLPTAVTVPEFIPYNPQAFFGQQAATVQMPIESADVPQEQANTIQRPAEENNNFGTFSTIMGLLNAATPQESVPVMAQAQAKASSPYIVNRFDKGGSKKSGGSFYQTHKARWNNYLLRHGVPAKRAAKLSTFFAAQDTLESGHGTSSAARQKNNFGGMQSLDKKTNKMVNVSYPSIDAYMDAKWKMMRNRFGRALNANSIQEYSNLLNDPRYHGKGYMYALYEGYRDGKPLDVARQTQHMNNYTRMLMDIAGEKGFKEAPVPAGSQLNEVEAPASIARPENTYLQFVPFTPFNPQAFGAPQAFVVPTREEFEVEQPIVEAANDYAYSPEQLEKEERRQGLNNLSFILGMMNGGNGSSFANTIGMLTGNIAAKGGPIHIKPENRGKFTALKERTGHSATWFKEHGTPAQRKMATFALNARHWKHGDGGNLYYDGGDIFSKIQRMLSDAQNMSRFAKKPSYEEALKQAGERVEKERKDYLTTSNDNTWVEGRHGKQKNKHLEKRGVKGAKSHRLWEKEHPVLSTVENAAAAAPLAVAAYPFVAGAGELAYGIGSAAAATTAGQTLLPWIDAGLTSYFGAHGLNHAINEGVDGWGDAAMTALEVAPLGRLVKPMWNAAKSIRNFIPTSESNMSGVRYAYDRNPELANIGTLEDYNDYLKTVFPESKVKDINYHMGPKGLQELKPSTGEVYNTNPNARGIYVTPDKSYVQRIRKYTTTRLEKPSVFTYIKRNLIPGGWDKANDAFTDIYPVIIDTKNPLLTKGTWTWGIADKKYQSLMSNYDAIVNSGPKWYQNFNSMPETIVPKTEQSLILGSDADVAGFRRFMSNPQITAENAGNTQQQIGDVMSSSSFGDAQMQWGI